MGFTVGGGGSVRDEVLYDLISRIAMGQGGRYQRSSGGLRENELDGGDASPFGFGKRDMDLAADVLKYLDEKEKTCQQS